MARQHLICSLIASACLMTGCAEQPDPLELEVSVANDEIVRNAYKRIWFPSISEEEWKSVDSARRNLNFAWQFLDRVDASTADFWSLCQDMIIFHPDDDDFTFEIEYEKKIEEDKRGPIVPVGTTYRELTRIYETYEYDFMFWRDRYRKACRLHKYVEFDQLVEVHAALREVANRKSTYTQITLGAEIYVKNNRGDLTLSAHWIDWGIYVIGREVPVARGANRIEFIGGLEFGESITRDWSDELSSYRRKIHQAVKDFGLNQLFMRACLTAQPGMPTLYDRTWPGCIIYEEELASAVLKLATDLAWLSRLRGEVFKQSSEKETPPTKKV